MPQKTVLIPGASRPVGRAITRKFFSHNARLILPVFDWPESIGELHEEFKANSDDTLIMYCDLRSKDHVLNLKKAIVEKFGSLDILVNNIERGGMPVVHGSYDQPHNAEQWDLEFDTTLKAKWLLFNHLKDILAPDGQGAIVNISSIAGFTGRAGAAAPFFNDGYSAANRAVELFTQHWAREMAPTVRVNELRLGFVQHRHGEGTRGWQALTDVEKNNLLQAIALQRTGTPEEVAEAVYFLAVQATYLTGSVLQMDGGFLLGDTIVPPLPPGIL